MWLDSIRTRLAADGKVIVIMTRWHEDDLVARMLKQESRVHYLNLPCEAEEDDPILREPGEALGAILGKDNVWLEDFKRVYLTKEGSRVWNALFQGRPTAMEGNMFKRRWFRYYTTRKESVSPEVTLIPGHWDEIMQSWDCSFKDSDGSDFVAGQVWGRVGAEYYLLDRIKERLDLPGTCDAILQMKARWPKTGLILIEDKANGPAVVQLLKVRVPGIVAVNPDGGKIARANAVCPAFESGNVYFPDAEVAPWVIEYEEELCSFPNGTNDDEVDSTTQALNRLIYYTDHREPPQPPPRDAEEALSRRVDGHLEALIKHKNKKKGGFKQV